MLRGVRRSVEGGDAKRTPISHLTSCHLRIRQFLEAARRVASGEGSSLERREAGAAIVRYFRQAFPRHVLDEDQVIAPILTMTAPAVVERIHAEHVRDEADVERFVQLFEGVAADEGDAGLGAEQAALVVSLAARLEDHLAFEEAELFPLVEALGEDDSWRALTGMDALRGR
ncbi:MAG: hemerythrin domain-containing protein [Polyangiaceae bacterium]